MTWLQSFVFLLILLQMTHCNTNSDLKSLQEELFNTRNYKKMIPPRKDTTEPLIVYTSFHLHGINYLDEVEEKLTSTAHLELVWTDTFLTWNPDNYSDIDYFYLPQSQVWKPDISLQNGFTKLQELGDDVILVRIRYDGNILWTPYEVFETKCYIDIVDFPFDTQTCKLVFGAWTTLPVDLEFDLGTDEAELDSHQPNGVWTLVSSEVKKSAGTVIVYLHMKRKPQYYWFTILCPILFLSVLATFTFVIPVDSGEKMGYSMTVYLAFAVFFTIVSAALPINSQTTSYLSVYLITLLVLGTCIVMVTAVQVRLHHRPNHIPVPPFIQQFTKLCRRMQICTECPSKSVRISPQASPDGDTSTTIILSPTHGTVPKTGHDSDSGGDEDDVITWTDFSAALDIFFFYIFSILTLTLVIVFFVLAP